MSCAVSARAFFVYSATLFVTHAQIVDRFGTRGQFKLIFQLYKGLIISLPVSNFQDICGIAIDSVEAITRAKL